MSNMFKINDSFMDEMFPIFLASMAKTEIDKKRIMKLAELCDKHEVPFKKYWNIITEIGEWEASQDDVRS